MNSDLNLLDIQDDEHRGELSNNSSIIKVIGVGGGGGNAVNHMYLEGIEHVTYLVCNTDRQHLHKHKIPNKLCIGEKLAKGLGVGGRPELGRKAAEESEEDIRRALSDDTCMVFITAGMGGGTGTGAAPVVARIAKEMDILTVGIVTIPFLFEDKDKILKALDGLSEMSKNVDAILVINNELLRLVYPDLCVTNAMKKADETLTTATRAITDIITRGDNINLDFADVKTTLENGGAAIVSQGYSKKDDGIGAAIENALASPMLNSTNIENASKILFHASFSSQSEVSITHLQESVGQFSSRIAGRFNWIWGYGIDESLGDQIKVTILASGFDLNNIKETISEVEDMNRIKSVYGSIQGRTPLYSKPKSIILDDDDLDDDDFISFMTDTPTLRRLEGAELRFRKKGYDNDAPTTKVQLGRAYDHEPLNRTGSTTSFEPKSFSPKETSKKQENAKPASSPKTEIEWDTEIIQFGKHK